MERLKTEDPERYKQIQEDRERRRQYVEGLVRDQLTRLDQRLQMAQSQEEVNLISQISDTVGQLNDLRQQWQDIRELPDDQRHQKFEELATTTREAYQNLSTLRAQDRQMQLQQLAAQVGYSSATDQAQFAKAIQQIYQETDTSMERFMGFGHGRGGSGGGRGGSSSGQ